MNFIDKLPEEIWLQIFEFVNRKELQTSTILVCKDFFRVIRNSVKLSGEMKLSLVPSLVNELECQFINDYLGHWPKLTTLYMEMGMIDLIESI